MLVRTVTVLLIPVLFDCWQPRLPWSDATVRLLCDAQLVGEPLTLLGEPPVLLLPAPHCYPSVVDDVVRCC